MGAQVQTYTQHFKTVIVVQQTVGAASAALQTPTAAQLAAAGVTPNAGITPKPENMFVQAALSNTGSITVTPVAQGPATSGGPGYALAAGNNLSLATKNPADWLVIASAAAQVINIHYQYGTT